MVIQSIPVVHLKNDAPSHNWSWVLGSFIVSCQWSLSPRICTIVYMLTMLGGVKPESWLLAMYNSFKLLADKSIASLWLWDGTCEIVREGPEPWWDLPNEVIEWKADALQAIQFSQLNGDIEPWKLLFPSLGQPRKDRSPISGGMVPVRRMRVRSIAE
jgi:hypothetical protein